MTGTPRAGRPLALGRHRIHPGAGPTIDAVVGIEQLRQGGQLGARAVAAPDETELACAFEPTDGNEAKVRS